MIDWGDGTAPTSGKVALTGGATYAVSGKHTYAGGGVYPVTVRVRDSDYYVGVYQASAKVTPNAPRLTVGTPSGQIVLSWSVPAGSVTSYRVFRGTTPGGEGASPIAYGLTGTAYTDTSALNGKTYYYTVRAVNAAGLGPASNEVRAAPQTPGAPTLYAKIVSGQVALSWTVATGSVTGYNVYRGTRAGGESPTPLVSGLAGRSYTDTSATVGTTYFYKVKAVNAAGAGPASNEASAKP